MTPARMQEIQFAIIKALNGTGEGVTTSFGKKVIDLRAPDEDSKTRIVVEPSSNGRDMTVTVTTVETMMIHERAAPGSVISRLPDLPPKEVDWLKPTRNHQDVVDVVDWLATQYLNRPRMPHEDDEKVALASRYISQLVGDPTMPDGYTASRSFLAARDLCRSERPGTDSVSDPYRPWDKNITIDELYEREKARGSDHRMTNWGASTPPGRTFWTQPPGADHNEGYCEAVEADPHDLNWPEIEEDIRRLCVHHRGMKTPDTQLVYDPANPDKQITFTVLRKRLEAIDKAKAMTYKPRGVYPNGTDGGEDAMADAHIQWQAGVRRAIKGEN